MLRLILIILICFLLNTKAVLAQTESRVEPPVSSVEIITDKEENVIGQFSCVWVDKASFVSFSIQPKNNVRFMIRLLLNEYKKLGRNVPAINYYKVWGNVLTRMQINHNYKDNVYSVSDNLVIAVWTLSQTQLGDYVELDAFTTYLTPIRPGLYSRDFYNPNAPVFSPLVRKDPRLKTKPAVKCKSLQDYEKDAQKAWESESMVKWMLEGASEGLRQASKMLKGVGDSLVIFGGFLWYLLSAAAQAIVRSIVNQF